MGSLNGRGSGPSDFFTFIHDSVFRRFGGCPCSLRLSIINLCIIFTSGLHSGVLITDLGSGVLITDLGSGVLIKDLGVLWCAATSSKLSSKLYYEEQEHYYF